MKKNAASESRTLDDANEPITDSATAVAAEAMRTGVGPGAGAEQEIPGEEGRVMQMGDPDADMLGNEYVGDEGPGGENPTPDQNNVDEIGAAYGLQEQDGGPLRSAGEIMDARDRKRAELEAPGRPGRD